MYKEKYLKYKSKYLHLKRLVGGTPELNIECSEEIRLNGRNGVCEKCKYIHDPGVIDPLTNTSQSTCQLPTETTGVLGNAVPSGNILYFNHEQNLENPNKILKYNTVTRTFNIDSDRTMLINDAEYKSIKSYYMNPENGNLCIQMYPTNISTFCAEGNIVWVTRESKVASSGLDSCMFVVIVLNDGSKICIHHNFYDEEDFMFDSPAENASNYKNIPTLLTNSEITPDKVNKIYLCVNRTAEAYSYPKMSKFYRALTTTIYMLHGYSKYLVDNNDVFALRVL